MHESNLPSGLHRRTVLKSIAGVAAVSALGHPLEGLTAADAPTAAIGPVSGPSTGATHELAEFKIPVSGDDLPGLSRYRAAEIALDAEFVLPSGRKMRVPGFYSQDYKATGGGNASPVEGTAGWRVRFSGPEVGAYKGKVELRIKGQVAAARELPGFTLAKSGNHGMIRVSKTAPRYLEFEDGTSHFPIGQDVCWTTDVTRTIPGAIISSKDMPWDESWKRWFTRMGENKATWARVFMKETFLIDSGEPWQWELEKAWRLDQVLEIARRNNIHICLCFNPERSDAARLTRAAWTFSRVEHGVGKAAGKGGPGIRAILYRPWGKGDVSRQDSLRGGAVGLFDQYFFVGVLERD